MKFNETGEKNKKRRADGPEPDLSASTDPADTRREKPYDYL
jgi:hypothetical protein